MDQGTSKRTAGAIGLSIAAHVVAAVLLVFAPVTLPTPEPPQPTEFVIQIEEPVLPEPEVEVTPPPPDLPPDVPPEVSPAAMVRPTNPIERSLPQREATTVPQPSVAEIVPATPTPSLGERTSEVERVDPRTEAERRRILLDPANVARSSFTISGPGPSGPRGPQVAAATPGIDAEAVERELEGSLREQAMSRPHLSRAPFRLQRRPDGTHVYTGVGITGIVNRDGTVTIQQRPPIETDGFSTSGTMDVTDMFMRAAGQNPYAAEEEYFMEHTEELRTRLEDEARTASLQGGRTRIRGQLVQIWQDGTRSVAARRRAIFHLWRDNDGEEGSAQRLIEEWVRAEIPQTSPDAFTPDELRQYNARLDEGQAFRPYR